MPSYRRKRKLRNTPVWVVTFGDMMALLLCFFILLQMFSELKKDHEYQRVITAIKDAFGYSGGVGVMPVDDVPLNSMVEVLEEIAVENNAQQRESQNDAQGLDGPHLRVTRVREGIVFTIGGPTTFQEGSAAISDQGRAELEQLAILLAGRSNKVIVRGHAAAKYLDPGSFWDDLDDLSFHRARNVKSALVDFGIEDRVFRLEAVGMREPVNPRALNLNDVAENRRVEIILTEQTIHEFNQDVDFTSPSLVQGES